MASTSAREVTEQSRKVGWQGRALMMNEHALIAPCNVTYVAYVTYVTHGRGEHALIARLPERRTPWLG